MKRLYSLMALVLMTIGTVFGAKVTVVMNSTSKTMTLAKKGSTENVEVGTPESYTYTFNADPGTYVLTAIASDGTTVNGTIELTVTDEAEQSFTVLTNLIYATNSDWEIGQDYTINVTVTSREGSNQVITLGNSTTAGRMTFLALNGNSYYAEFVPSKVLTREGYMPLYKSGTLTRGVTVSGMIPKGADYTITLPKEAEFFLGIKFAHFIDFKKVEPTKETIKGDTKTLTYRLANNQQYNYRTWMSSGLTQAGYFTMNTDETKRPTLAFTRPDYKVFGAKTIKHDVNSNQGYETGDIFVNINERGHLRMKVGDTYSAHAMRSWQLTDNSTNNYFMEPDFHYTVIDVNGNPSSDVITIDNANTTTSPWSDIKAVGKGTAIVLVTYDAMGVNYYGSGKTEKTNYLGGEYWGAIWPENTAAYVVTVGDADTSINPNMLINEKYNEGAKKNAGKYVDAEHDVFYYLDTEAGANYTFTPTGVTAVEVARPVIGAQMATYKGFSADGVTKNDDGSYTLLLKEGRSIVRLTDASGNSVYQVLTAKSCHREIINASREGSKIFQPGDKVTIQYSGLRHPANKMAGIYNMSAYVTYNGKPNGTSLILGANQYTFGSAAKAQAVSLNIPADQDVEKNPEIVLNEGVIQVNGFGDPIGNHRYIDRIGGRSPNFTAVAHKTYFGLIPDVSIKVTAVKDFVIKAMCKNVENAEITVSLDGKKLTPNADGTYTGTYGTYAVEAKAKGYKAYYGTFTIGDDAEGNQSYQFEMNATSGDAWDGKTLIEPKAVDDVYQIGNGEELAWFANKVNTGTYKSNAVLTNDIDLADYVWTPIGGTTTSTAFQGEFDGAGHTVKGLYINSTAICQGFFGYVDNANISNLTIEGVVKSTGNNVGGIVACTNGTVNITRCINRATVNGKQYVSGIVGYSNFGATVIDRCQNFGDVTATSSYAAGICSYLYSATCTLTNCYNEGTITGTGNVATLVAFSNAACKIKNNLNTGKVVCDNTTTGNVRTATSAATANENNYVLQHYNNGTDYETVVTESQLASGEVAVLLGEAWGQNLDKDKLPVIDGMKVFKTDYGYSNNNPAYDDLVNFEDVNLKGAQYYNGADEAYSFTSAGYTFLNNYNTAYGSWNGFAVSATTGTDFQGWNTPSAYNSCVGGGMESAQFAVGYYDEYNSNYNDQTPSVYAEKAFKPEYVYVTNAAYAYTSMLNGDTYAKKFDENDYLLLKITGRTSDGDETGHVDFYLAKDGKIVNEWTKVDLTPLKAVDHIEFTMDSSDKSEYGINTPTYFCLDNMKSELTDDTPVSGIDDITKDEEKVTVVGIYTIDGRKVEEIQPGINILKMSDGTSRKYLMRY